MGVVHICIYWAGALSLEQAFNNSLGVQVLLFNLSHASKTLACRSLYFFLCWRLSFLSDNNLTWIEIPSASWKSNSINKYILSWATVYCNCKWNDDWFKIAGLFIISLYNVITTFVSSKIDWCSILIWTDYNGY